LPDNQACRNPWPHYLSSECIIFKDKPFDLFCQFNLSFIIEMKTPPNWRYIFSFWTFRQTSCPLHVCTGYVAGHVSFFSVYSKQNPVVHILCITFAMLCDQSQWINKWNSIKKPYHTPVPILRLRKYGIARPCIYFDVTSLAL
jgi:hypothetical protein